MSYLKDFLIPFRGLNTGEHKFNWEIEKKFFETNYNPDIIDSKICVDLNLEKQERMMVLAFDIKGQVTVVCDRCLDDLVMKVDIMEELFIKFGQERIEESDNVLIIPESDYQLELGSLINEYITLALPMKKTHEYNNQGDVACNTKTIKKLEELKRKESIDSRWDKLKDIKLD